MSQIRFKIRTPRAGSAARSAEEANSSAETDGWTRAKKVSLSGSAARAAEELKRAEGVARKQGNVIGLRASGGAVVDRETMIRHSERAAHSEPQENASANISQRSVAPVADFTEGERISSSRTVSADAVPGVAADGEPDDGSSGTTDQPGLLQSAAARIQSLTRSLFQRGTRTANRK